MTFEEIKNLNPGDEIWFISSCDNEVFNGAIKEIRMWDGIAFLCSYKHGLCYVSPRNMFFDEKSAIQEVIKKLKQKAAEAEVSIKKSEIDFKNSWLKIYKLEERLNSDEVKNNE